jgi:hypothetical protein
MRPLEERDSFLEGFPGEDTVLVLDELAAARAIGVTRATTDVLPPVGS